jgi:hypothetical protein
LCAARITPELRARYDALVSTSTSVERLHALGRNVDDRCKHQRVDSRAGIALAAFNDQAGWLGAKTAEEQAARLDAARAEASKARRTTLKAMLVAAGRAKREEREKKLGGKRAAREKKRAEAARLAKVALATRYSQLVTMEHPELVDQLKLRKAALKAAGKPVGFAVTMKGGRPAYVTQLQKLIFDAEGNAANDLADGDSGCGAERVVRKQKVAPPPPAAQGAKRKGSPPQMQKLVAGGKEYEWAADEVFKIERILDKKMVAWQVGKVRRPISSPRAFRFCLSDVHPPSLPAAKEGPAGQDEGLPVLPRALGGLAARDGDVAVPRAARHQGRHPPPRRRRVRGQPGGRGAAGRRGGGGGC